MDKQQLRPVDIFRCPKLEKKAHRLYISAFPKEERIPWLILKLNSRRKGIDLTAWLDGKRFCGFTSSVTVEELHFLLFFAVEEACRGQGYGSAILTALKQKYGNVVLNVELLDPNAPNYAQRVNRFAFYRKNGFFDTGYHVWEVGGEFAVLATATELDVPRYKKLFRKLTLGVWDVKIIKEKES